MRLDGLDVARAELQEHPHGRKDLRVVDRLVLVDQPVPQSRRWRDCGTHRSTGTRRPTKRKYTRGRFFRTPVPPGAAVTTVGGARRPGPAGELPPLQPT